MTELSKHYAYLLEVGFLVLRQAIASGNVEWATKEFEYLHNVPTLIFDTRHHRHANFWNFERKSYIAWVNQQADERIRSRLAIYHTEAWDDMEAAINQFLAGSAESE